MIDGNPIRTLGVEHTAVVGGDARCHSIACASIIAKVTRDRLMRALARRHPHYHWETNVGLRHARASRRAGVARDHGAPPPLVLAGGAARLALTVAPLDEAGDVADALTDVLDGGVTMVSGFAIESTSGVMFEGGQH